MNLISPVDPDDGPASREEFLQVADRRAKFKLPQSDYTYWRRFKYLKLGVEVTVFYQKDMVLEEIKAWRVLEQWTRTIFADLSKQNDQVHPYHKDPYTLHYITVESFNHLGMGIMADIRNSADNYLPGTLCLPPSMETTKVGIMVTVACKVTAADIKYRKLPSIAKNKYVMVIGRPRISAGRLQFLEIPTGIFTDSGIEDIIGWKEIMRLLPGPPSRVLNMSEIAITGAAPGSPGLVHQGNLALGVQHDGLRGSVQNGHTYQHTQIMLREHKLPLEEFEALVTKVRNGFMEDRTGTKLPDSGSTVRLVNLVNMPWACVGDIYSMLAWGLYNNLEATQRIGYGPSA
ncbi:hypothetical protein ONS95_004303 [Cadophora gregata]|uniref:uncharacterized protein n=1 Tax=Cadophora gregata TaxID=51156 RepID=UPI0026DC9852|nr:uncharacterized protein ONS95_004303 [Cadophora gregata]KAK0105314.1 hypothetical protein ONS96_004710 [Cadophora gregata f. sp. sojae]KAK0105785.1 hypothetical protein ONS95_004303 [Cadophora gregata]